MQIRQIFLSSILIFSKVSFLAFGLIIAVFGEKGMLPDYLYLTSVYALSASIFLIPVQTSILPRRYSVVDNSLLFSKSFRLLLLVYAVLIVLVLLRLIYVPGIARWSFLLLAFFYFFGTLLGHFFIAVKNQKKDINAAVVASSVFYICGSCFFLLISLVFGVSFYGVYVSLFIAGLLSLLCNKDELDFSIFKTWLIKREEFFDFFRVFLSSFYGYMTLVFAYLLNSNALGLSDSDREVFAFYYLFYTYIYFVPSSLGGILVPYLRDGLSRRTFFLVVASFASIGFFGNIVFILAQKMGWFFSGGWLDVYENFAFSMVLIISPLCALFLQYNLANGRYFYNNIVSFFMVGVVSINSFCNDSILLNMLFFSGAYAGGLLLFFIFFFMGNRVRRC